MYDSQKLAPVEASGPRIHLSLSLCLLHSAPRTSLGVQDMDPTERRPLLSWDNHPVSHRLSQNQMNSFVSMKISSLKCMHAHRREPVFRILLLCKTDHLDLLLGLVATVLLHLSVN